MESVKDAVKPNDITGKSDKGTSDGKGLKEGDAIPLIICHDTSLPQHPSTSPFHPTFNQSNQPVQSHSSVGIPPQASFPQYPSTLTQHPFPPNHVPPLSPALLPVFSFNPAHLGYYYGVHSSTPAGSPAPHLAPGFCQLPTSPGFLTQAGYIGVTSRQPGSPILIPQPGSPIGPLHQNGPSLHSAAMLGDAQKVAELLEDRSTDLEVRDRWGRVPLVYAVLGNSQEVVELLLFHGARPHAIDANKCTPLHFAAFKGYLGCVKALVQAWERREEKAGGLWLAQDMRGISPLHHAAHHASKKCLHALLRLAAPGTLDTLDHKKRTPLHWAAAYGSEENVRLLVKFGANDLLPDQEGKTPLHWAAMSKAEDAKECVRTLVRNTPSSVNWQDYDGVTALHLAVAEARLDIVEVILAVPKCKVDLTDNHFRTALHWACNRGLTTIVSRLLERGAHASAVDEYGATPLHYAAQLNHSDTVERMVRRPTAVETGNQESHSALLWAAARGADAALTLLIRYGSPLTQADSDGSTALHIAAGSGHVSTVGVLLKLHAPLEACASDGCTPLLHAAQGGHAHIVKLLAKAGASLDHRDNEGQCALHHAVLGGHLYLAQILLRAGTNVNVRDYSGRTPLHMAAYRGLNDVLCLLLENQGDVNGRDYEGQSPLHWAAQQGHLGAVNTLLDFRAYPNYTRSTDDRYTALDCAYVAEQLEIVQVLVEAGGVSITRITDIAATKIQSLVRGALARKRLREAIGRKLPDDITSTSVRTPNSTYISSVDETSIMKELKTNETICDKTQSPIGQLQANEEGRKSKFRDHRKTNAFNSVSGQRRARVLGSSILRGPRKKTVRNLQLPNPHELGLKKQNDEEPWESNCESSDSDEDYVTNAIRGPSLVLAHALHLPGAMASALITHSHGDSPLLLDHSRQSSIANNRTDTDQNTKYSGTIDDDSSACDKIEEKITTNVYKNVTKQDKNVIEIKEEEILDNQIASLRKGLEKVICKSDKDDDKIMKLEVEKENKDSNKNFDGDKEETIFSRKSNIENKNYVFNESDNSPAMTDQTHIKRHPVLSIDERRQAMQKWNKKLASVKIQVESSQNAKPGINFSYNLATSPSNPARTLAKNQEVKQL